MSDVLMDMTGLEPRLLEAASLMEMLSQPARLKILCLMLEGECAVGALAEAAGMSQPAMSHHLRRLREAGLVDTRREAQTILYRLKGREVAAVLHTLHDLYCPDGIPHSA